MATSHRDRSVSLASLAEDNLVQGSLRPTNVGAADAIARPGEVQLTYTLLLQVGSKAHVVTFSHAQASVHSGYSGCKPRVAVRVVTAEEPHQLGTGDRLPAQDCCDQKAQYHMLHLHVNVYFVVQSMTYHVLSLPF